MMKLTNVKNELLVHHYSILYILFVSLDDQ